MPELVCVAPSDIGRALPLARPMLAAAMNKTGLGTIDEIERALMAGYSLLWLAWSGEAIKACATTELNGAACTITACGGSSMAEWLPLLAGIEAYAKAEDCTVVRFYGRRGWLRVLPEYRQAAIVGEKRI